MSDTGNGSTGNLCRHLKNKHYDKWSENDQKEEENFVSLLHNLSL